MKRMYKMSRLLFTAAVASLFLAGCSAGKAPQVIGEKPGASQAASEQPSMGGESSGESKSSDGGEVQAQVQAPERYQADVKDDAVIILADAPVTVPDVRQLDVKKANTVNFTEEEYQRVKDTLTDQLKISWKADAVGTEDNSSAFKTVAEEGHDDKGADYRTSYRTALEESGPSSSLIWVTRMILEKRSSTRSAHICASDDEEAVSRSAKAKELEKKAGELLKAAGFGNYREYRGMWRQSFYTLSGKDQEQTEMEYIITYTPVVDGVGCTENVVNLFGTSYLYGPYIKVYYEEDGTLNQLKIIDKEAVEDSNNAESFLLPFESIHELFIQYWKDYFQKESGTDTSAGAKEKNPLSDGLQPVVMVKNVRLEYAFLQKEGGQPDEMELAPVWNFYGCIKKGYVSQEDGSVKTEDYWTASQDPEGVILSIRADDGQILAD